MADLPPRSTTIQWLEAAFAVCHIRTDSDRLTHLEPLASSLLADGESLIGKVDHAVEPMAATHIAQSESPHA